MRFLGPENKIRNTDIEALKGSELQWLERGVLVHLETDRLFHQSAYFEQKTALLKNLLRSNSLFDKYLFFYAHLLLELMLDRIIMKVKPAMATTFYNHLNFINKATISDYFRYKGIDAGIDRFMQFFDRFRESQYLLQYVDNEGFIFALERTTMRIGLPAFKKTEKKQFINLLNEIETTLSTDYLSIFNEIENQVPA